MNGTISCSWQYGWISFRTNAGVIVTRGKERRQLVKGDGVLAAAELICAILQVFQTL